MAGWIKLPLGREVGHDQISDIIVLYGDSTPIPKKGAELPMSTVIQLLATHTVFK